MLPSQMRAELVKQHAEIRAGVKAVRAMMRRMPSEAVKVEKLRTALAELAGRVEAHNRQEHDLLHEFLSTVDAWGAVRNEIMDETHDKEHAEIQDALGKAAGALDGEILSRVAGAFDLLEEHMRLEEKTFLGADVLRDDDAPVDSSGSLTAPFLR
jgi:hypothetical protein